MTRTRKRIAIAVVEGNAKEDAEDSRDFDDVLIGLRAPGAPLAGYWEFPGGKVHDGESFEAAAIRECMEETGLQVEIVDEFPQAEFDYDHDSVHLRFFRCRIASPHDAPKNGFRWVRKSELGQFQFPEANDALIRLLQSQPSA